MGYKNLVDYARSKCLDGIVLDKEEIIDLLGIDDSGDDFEYLCSIAFDVAKRKTDNKAYLWGAIGIDFVPCQMSCDFCSFGSKWGIVNEKKIYSIEEITSEVERYVRQKIHYIVLRSTQFYDISVLLDIVAHIRSHVKGNYELILNVGEFDLATADKMYEAGVNGIYHAIRLREGIDTRFNVDDRRKTLTAVRDSKLKLIHLIEPLGEEHTPEEIADRFLESVSYGVNISGIMARIPVKGTPLGNTKRISDNIIAKHIAMARLSGGDVVKDICVHPASALAVSAGANVTVIEKGAVPRDINFSCDEWNDFKCLEAAQLFVDCGYAIC